MNKNGQDIVTVVCYGIPKKYERSEAIAFFKRGVRECSGSERDRYMNIWCGLCEDRKPNYVRDDGITATITDEQ